MEALCDLHAHSVFSDGTYTPAQLLDEAERIGLKAVALTDHNTVAGLPDFLAAAQGRAVEAVPGVEFSTNYLGIELHILALGIRPEHFAAVTDQLQEGVIAKEKSNRDLARALAQEGYELDYEAMKAATPGGQLNRLHFAAELVKKGYVPDRQTAFQKLLSPKGGLYNPPIRLSAVDAICFILSQGAVPVLAHPFLDLKEEAAVRTFLSLAVPAGLAGMEVQHPSHSPLQREKAQQLVAEFGILPSGGSDFHGQNKPGIALGSGRGDLAVSLQFWQELQKCNQ